MSVVQAKIQQKTFHTLLTVTILLGSCFDIFNVAQGTGVWFHGFSITWALIFSFYLVITFLAIIGGVLIIWRDSIFLQMTDKLLTIRKRLGYSRWVIAIGVFIFPVYFFQFTVWGIVFHGLFIRLMIWFASLLLFSILVSDGEELITWHRFLSAIILMTGTFAIAAALRYVSDYPFSQGWSEGNRIWDYSILFGRDRYIYPPNLEIPVALDMGRQFIGGLPFLIPGVTIQYVRLWTGLIGIIPYLLIGVLLFRFLWMEKKLYIVLIFWTYLFLAQGPIHPPLVLSTILVVLAWRSPTWISVIIIAIASGAASVSRFTWTFAPTIWLLMLELSDVIHANKGVIPRSSWHRLIVLTLSGLAGGLILPAIFTQSDAILFNIEETIQASHLLPENIKDKVTSQPLLWGRLLPNSTYRPGILLGLLMAVGPLLFLGNYLACKKIWIAYFWQHLTTIFCLLAFFIVGIIVSTKIGGGGDLHNMDMFLIGLLMVAVIVWNQGGREWLGNSQYEVFWIRVIIVCVLVFPGIKPLQEMHSYNFGDKASWLAVLTDTPNERELDIYASEEVAEKSLEIIQSEATNALRYGEVLFMDQRQLLTFGYITGIPLVPDYDKKLLIERSFSENRTYFERFYSDLEANRFSLIIVQALSTQKKNSDDQFGEENDSWVEWVTRPLLCYYEIKQTLVNINVQLLVPKTVTGNCASQFP